MFEAGLYYQSFKNIGLSLYIAQPCHVNAVNYYPYLKADE